MTAKADSAADVAFYAATETPMRGARLALLLLILINLFNYIDRQVLAAVEPQIRKELFPEAPDAAAARAYMGWLGSAFLIFYMIAAPIFGFLADRMPRWWLIGVGVLLWTGASGASGGHWGMNLTIAFWFLFLTRCFVGIGEAAYGPVAPTVIADLFPVKHRGRVMAWFYMAIPCGGALGYALGAGVLAADLNWRWAFYLVVPPGMLLGLLCFWMKEPPAGSADGVEAMKHRLTGKDYLSLLHTPSYVLNTLGMTGMTFAIGGLAYWMPDYLEYRKVEPLFGTIPPVMAFGGITAISGLLATIAGGLAGDWLRRYHSGSYFLVSGVAMLLGFPMVLLMLWIPFPLAWIFVFLAVACLFFNTGPTNTVLANVTHPSVRATGFAINILIIHLFGDVASPPLMGLIAGHWNQDVSFIVVSAMVLVGGLFWIWGARYLERDTELAPTRLEARD
jgi:MFS family permease